MFSLPTTVENKSQQLPNFRRNGQNTAHGCANRPALALTTRKLVFAFPRTGYKHAPLVLTFWYLGHRLNN